jgi:hypothetical protein
LWQKYPVKGCRTVLGNTAAKIVGKVILGRRSILQNRTKRAMCVICTAAFGRSVAGPA